MPDSTERLRPSRCARVSWVRRGCVPLGIAVVLIAAGCTPYALKCQPELNQEECQPAAEAAVTAAPLGLGRIVGVEVCSVGLATLCQLHERPTDVILTLADGTLIGVAVSRTADERIEATAYWDAEGRIDH